MDEPGLIRCGGRVLRVGARTLVIGIVNLTPDSFTGDGVGQDAEAAVRRGRAMVNAGVDILDVGGESTRPGAETISEELELARVLPALEALAGLTVPVSIDTRKARVAEAALAAGATVVNDVSGLDFDPRMAEVATRSGAALIVGHWRQHGPGYPSSLIDWVAEGLEDSVARAQAAGVRRTQIIADPGLGFAKPPPWSLEILRGLKKLRAAVGLPILIGASRKGFVGRVLDLPVKERLEGSLAAAVMAVASGADLVRVHDVSEAVRAVRMADAIVRGWSEQPLTWTPVYFGLGSNLGDRAANLARAFQALSTRTDVRVTRRSGLYETAPIGVTDQPPFLNAVVEAETTLPPRELLTLSKRVEADLGRQTGPRWGPRPIDVDILLYGDEQIDSPELTIPHAEMWDRLFVLAPLGELLPELVSPDGSAVAERVAELGGIQAMRRVT